MAFSSSAAAPNVVMDNGTSCTASARFVAVTVMVSSSADAGASSAAATSVAINPAPIHTTPRLPISMIISLNDDLRIIPAPPCVSAGALSVQH